MAKYLVEMNSIHFEFELKLMEDVKSFAKNACLKKVQIDCFYSNNHVGYFQE